MVKTLKCVSFHCCLVHSELKAFLSILSTFEICLQNPVCFPHNWKWLHNLLCHDMSLIITIHNILSNWKETVQPSEAA